MLGPVLKTVTTRERTFGMWILADIFLNFVLVRPGFILGYHTLYDSYTSFLELWFRGGEVFFEMAEAYLGHDRRTTLCDDLVLTLQDAEEPLPAGDDSLLMALDQSEFELAITIWKRLWGLARHGGKSI